MHEKLSHNFSKNGVFMHGKCTLELYPRWLNPCVEEGPVSLATRTAAVWPGTETGPGQAAAAD